MATIDYEREALRGRDAEEKRREENCECGIDEDGKWSEALFDKFGCTCE